jgi:hypothetical protein
LFLSLLLKLLRLLMGLGGPVDLCEGLYCNQCEESRENFLPLTRRRSDQRKVPGRSSSEKRTEAKKKDKPFHEDNEKSSDS